MCAEHLIDDRAAGLPAPWVSARDGLLVVRRGLGLAVAGLLLVADADGLTDALADVETVADAASSEGSRPGSGAASPG